MATLESNATAVPTQVNERDAREAERLDRLEASVKALLALAQKNEASLRDVRSRIDSAQADRSGSTVTTLLFVLLLLSLLAIVYLLTRMSRRQEHGGERWFDARPMPDTQFAPPQQTARSARAPLPEGGTAPMPRTAPVPLADRQPGEPAEPTRPMAQEGGVRDAGTGNAQVDVSLVEMSESTFDLLMQSGPTHNAQRQARATMPMMGGQKGSGECR